MASSDSKKSKAKTKKTTGKENGAPPKQAGLQELILNKRTGKYEVIDQMSFWAKQLRKQEEHRHLTQTEILDLSICEVLSGKVSKEELDNLMAKGEASAKKKESSDKSTKK